MCPPPCISPAPLIAQHLRLKFRLFTMILNSFVSFEQPLLGLIALLLQTKMKVFVTQWCPTLCNPLDYSPKGSSVHGISQARMLDWVAISSSKGYS